MFTTVLIAALAVVAHSAPQGLLLRNAGVGCVTACGDGAVAALKNLKLDDVKLKALKIDDIKLKAGLGLGMAGLGVGTGAMALGAPGAIGFRAGAIAPAAIGLRAGAIGLGAGAIGLGAGAIGLGARAIAPAAIGLRAGAIAAPAIGLRAGLIAGVTTHAVAAPIIKQVTAIQPAVIKKHYEIPVTKTVHYADHPYVAGHDVSIHKPSIGAPLIAAPRTLIGKKIMGATTVTESRYPAVVKTINKVAVPYNVPYDVPHPYPVPVPVKTAPVFVKKRVMAPAAYAAPVHAGATYGVRAHALGVGAVGAVGFRAGLGVARPLGYRAGLGMAGPLGLRAGFAGARFRSGAGCVTACA